MRNWRPFYKIGMSRKLLEFGKIINFKVTTSDSLWHLTKLHKCSSRLPLAKQLFLVNTCLLHIFVCMNEITKMNHFNFGNISTVLCASVKKYGRQIAGSFLQWTISALKLKLKYFSPINCRTKQVSLTYAQA